MQSKDTSVVYAGFFVRFAAYLIDWLIVGSVLLVVRLPIWIATFSGADFLSKDFIFQYSAADIVLYVLKVLYFTLMTYYTGSTLGKKLFQLQVVSAEEGRKPTLFEIVFRESVGKFLSSLIIYVGYIMIGIDKDKRGLHDILSDTRVIYCHKKTVAIPTPVQVQEIHYTVPAQNTAAQQMPQQSFGQMPQQQSAGQMPQQQPLDQMQQQSAGRMPQQQSQETVHSSQEHINYSSEQE